MAALDLTAITPVLRQVFPNGKYPKDLTYKKSPFMGIIPKDETAEKLGDTIKVPLRYSNPQGRSATESAVLGVSSGQSPSKFVAFLMTTYNDYCATRITGAAIDRSKSDVGSFVRATKSDIDASMRTLTRSANHALFRNGGGAIGRLASAASGVGTATITLSDPADMVWFEVNQVVQGSAADGTSGAARVGTATISAVDRALGTLTTAGGNWSAQITGLTDSDYLFMNGDFGLKFPGLDAWCPLTAPGATLFFGVDRTPDSMRLGGVRSSSAFTGVPIEEAMLAMVELVTRQGGEPDTIVMHTQDFANLQKSLGTRARYAMVPSYDDAKIGFRAIEVILGDVEIKIFADRDCQRGRVFVLQLDTWKLYSLGGLPKALNNDGLDMLRVVTADAVEFQGVYRAALGCDAPGFNGQFQIS